MWAALLTFPIPFTGLYSFQTGIWILGFCLLASAIGMMLQGLVIEKPNDPLVTLDLRFDYRQAFRSGTFSCFIELANATNRYNPYCVDFDLDPDGSGGVILDKKEDYWLPILPPTGILWEF